MLRHVVAVALALLAACGPVATDREPGQATPSPIQATPAVFPAPTPSPTVATAPPTDAAATPTAASAGATAVVTTRAPSPAATSTPLGATPRATLTATPPPSVTATAAPAVPAPPPTLAPSAIAAAPETARRDCSAEQATRSASTGATTSVEFVNATGANVEVFWLDGAGKRSLYRSLLPGQRFTQPTYASHAWLVAFSGGACIGIYVAQPEPGRLTVGNAETHAFYTQQRTVDGFAVKASAKVAPTALDEAARLFALLLRGDPKVVEGMRARGVAVALIAQSEATTDLPEYAQLKGKTTPDGRAYDGPTIRGLGGIPCSAGEENLLRLPGDIFAGESILIHECSHSVYLHGLDATQRQRWDALYAAAMAAGRWAKTYAATNADEFFAELTQSFFGMNQRPNAVHNDVNGAARLATYEPDAYDFLVGIFGAPP